MVASSSGKLSAVNVLIGLLVTGVGAQNAPCDSATCVHLAQNNSALQKQVSLLSLTFSDLQSQIQALSDKVAALEHNSTHLHLQEAVAGGEWRRLVRRKLDR
eukprot:SAG31_NODE_13916_length_838_cov_0.661705_2_plen_102_part_00